MTTVSAVRPHMNNDEEPANDCPTHGYPWPPRCDCGRFVRRAAQGEAGSGAQG